VQRGAGTTTSASDISAESVYKLDCTGSVDVVVVVVVVVVWLVVVVVLWLWLLLLFLLLWLLCRLVWIAWAMLRP